ncbi:hypothetical protein F4560_003229 [Saccharothrix ecbatanensis]|uniref:Uncharacterized protein n=1 Tax=Saccharothrix ecbatanensis TaxID=1105145 RepID=A0A7W9HJY0_9PSEU|nr:hypothetical protein [Saccharothrix ecbatanensis]MBB5803461.1 hypothetical protein [Saccharothrix ecbatanensis]
MTRRRTQPSHIEGYFQVTEDRNGENTWQPRWKTPAQRQPFGAGEDRNAKGGQVYGPTLGQRQPFAATALNLIRLDAWWNGSSPRQRSTSHLARLHLTA